MDRLREQICRRTLGSHLSDRRLLAIASIIVAWVAARSIAWIGFAGADDFYYLRYAWEFNRLPINHWEFRLPAILALRASLLTFGPSEFAACVPTLLASLAMLAAVAWFVDWPRQLNWHTQTSMLLACVLPLDAAMASYPNAALISTGFLVTGTICVLRGKLWTQYLGAVLLAVGFLTHELYFYYVAIFCLTALAFDWRRMWRPVLACVVVSGCFFLVECLAYNTLLGEPLARYHTAAQIAERPLNIDRRFGGSVFLFYAWPIQILFFCRQFGFDLILLFALGFVAWKHFDRSQRILFVTMLCFWGWMGYGTHIPWSYKPHSRQFYYLAPLSLGICALLPSAIQLVIPGRPRTSQGIAYSTIVVHVLCLFGDV